MHTWSLTVGADTLSPNSAAAASKTTIGDDTIRAVTAASFETEDSIDGGAGTDTINVSAGAFGATAAPSMKNVEIVNITGAAAAMTVNFNDVTGVTKLNGTSTNAAAVITVNNIESLSTVVGTGKSTAAGVIDVDFRASTAGTADTFNAALGNNNANAMTIQSTADSGTFEAISLAANGSKSGASVAGDNAADVVTFLAADFGTVKTLTVTGDGNSDITLASGVLATVNAANANGNNTYTLAGAAGKTVTTGAGNDTIIGGAGDDTFNTGAGNDTITGGAGNDTFNGGLGADTYNDAAGTDTFVVQTSTIEDLGFDTIASGFVSGTDVIKFFGGVAATATNYAEAITAGTGFVSARSAATTSLTNDANLKYVAIQDAAGNTYVFFDGNGDHTLTTNGSDFAVMITGVAITGLAFGDILAG